MTAQDPNGDSVSRRRFLLAAGSSAAALGLSTLGLAAPVYATRPGGSRSGEALILGRLNEAQDETDLQTVPGAGAEATLRITPPREVKGKGLFINIEGDEYQRSGVWVRTNATATDTLVGLFVENAGKGDGIFVENTEASNKASGIAVISRSNSLGFNCLHDSISTFFEVRRTDREIQFGDFLSFKPAPADRKDERSFFIGGDGRLRTRVGIGNAEGIQMRRDQLVEEGATFKDVSLIDQEATSRDMVGEPDAKLWSGRQPILAYDALDIKQGTNWFQTELWLSFPWQGPGSCQLDTLPRRTLTSTNLGWS